MILIKEIVLQALTRGYLSTREQKQIRVLLQTSYDSEDLDAFIILERAVSAGEVKLEPKTRITSLVTKSKQTSSNLRQAYQIAAESAFASAIALSLPPNQPATNSPAQA